MSRYLSSHDDEDHLFGDDTTITKRHRHHFNFDDDDDDVDDDYNHSDNEDERRRSHSSSDSSPAMSSVDMGESTLRGSSKDPEGAARRLVHSVDGDSDEESEENSALTQVRREFRQALTTGGAKLGFSHIRIGTLMLLLQTHDC